MILLSKVYGLQFIVFLMAPTKIIMENSQSPTPNQNRKFFVQILQHRS